jgi:hypothetical protein
MTAIWPFLPPRARTESADSLHALHTQHFFALLRPWPCNESVDSLHHMGHFFDFCPNPCNESQDSSRASRTQPIFVELCPYQRDESVNSSRDECRFSGFSHFQRDESVNSSRDECRFSGFSHFRRDECRFSDFCQASIHPSSFCLHPLFPPSAFRLSTEFAIRAWAGVICSGEGAIAVRANVVFAAILAGATPRFQASGAFGGVLETFAERVGDTGRPLPSARRRTRFTWRGQFLRPVGPRYNSPGNRVSDARGQRLPPFSRSPSGARSPTCRLPREDSF